MATYSKSFPTGKTMYTTVLSILNLPRWAAQKSLNLWIWSTSSLVSADPGKCWVTFTWQSWRYGLLMAQWQWLMFSTFDIFTLAQVTRRGLIGDVSSIRKTTRVSWWKLVLQANWVSNMPSITCKMVKRMRSLPSQSKTSSAKAKRSPSSWMISIESCPRNCKKSMNIISSVYTEQT